MDQLTAHLDRGWDLAQKGDVRGAESSARRAIELCPDSPEAHNLLGYVTSLDGDCEEAVEAYQQAIFLDDTYVEAMLNAAELLVHPLGEWDEAVEMCDRVLELSEYEDEILDALLLKFEALWSKGEEDDARKILRRLPPGPYESPAHDLLAGRAFVETGDFEKAKPLVAAALEGDPQNAEAHYYAALLSELDGDYRAATLGFLRVRGLELEAGLPPWAPNDHTLLAMVKRAIDELDEPLRAMLAEAEIYLIEMPGAEMIVDGVDVHAQAMVDAAWVPLEDGSRTSATPTAENTTLRVFLYAINLMRTAGSLHALQQCIRDALDSEVRAALEDLVASTS